MRELDSFSSAFYLKKANDSNTLLQTKSLYPLLTLFSYSLLSFRVP